jgi:hypothetical protein
MNVAMITSEQAQRILELNEDHFLDLKSIDKLEQQASSRRDELPGLIQETQSAFQHQPYRERVYRPLQFHERRQHFICTHDAECSVYLFVLLL